MTAPRAPSHLPAEGKRLWRKVQEVYAIQDPSGLALLETAALCFGRMRQIEAEIGDELTVEDRFGQLRPHPSLQTVREYRASFLVAIKALELSMDDLEDVLRRRP